MFTFATNKLNMSLNDWIKEYAAKIAKCPVYYAKNGTKLQKILLGVPCLIPVLPLYLYKR